MEYRLVSFSGSRDINEDSAQVIIGNNCKCMVVADGLGGHGRGDTASQLAVKAFEEVFTASDLPLHEQFSAAFYKAQEMILAEQKNSGNCFQMKTTVCALAIKEGKTMWGHIGDTRLYAFSHNRVKIRTLDHSVPQMLVLAHEIKEIDIRNHPDRNKLLRALGVSGDSPMFELSEEYDTKRFQAFLICSDGFWELIQEKEMCALLKKSASVEEWLNRMCEVVRRNGTMADMDNFTAIAVWI